MAQVPHERALVKRMKGKPFILLGVNGNYDVEDARQAMAARQITWRSWQNRSIKKGKITQLYQVPGFPAIYLIDKKGIIRAFYLGAGVSGEKLERRINELIDEKNNKVV
jgi:hypothetical protein